MSNYRAKNEKSWTNERSDEPNWFAWEKKSRLRKLLLIIIRSSSKSQSYKIFFASKKTKVWLKILFTSILNQTKVMFQQLINEGHNLFYRIVFGLVMDIKILQSIWQKRHFICMLFNWTRKRQQFVFVLHNVISFMLRLWSINDVRQ